MSALRPRPEPPRPELDRRPREAFGWLEARLLHDGWLRRLGPDATSVLLLLALAGDRQGASFFSRGRMADLLGFDRPQLDRALEDLCELSLVAHRPFRPGHPDGVWQLLPVPLAKPRAQTEAEALGTVLATIARTAAPRAGNR